MVHERLQLFAVIFERHPARLGHATERQRHLTPVGLLDRDIARLLELREMHREVSLGQAGFALQVEEIRALHRTQDRQDDRAGGFVDEPVHVREVAQVIAHRVPSGGAGV